MTDCLFVGSFLSNSKGSLSISEFVAQELKAHSIRSKLTSFRQNKLLRIIDIMMCILFSQTRIIHIELYSGMAFRIAEVAVFCARLVNSPIVLALHGGRLPEFAKENPVRIAKLFTKVQTLITPSLYLKNFFENQGYSLKYLPNSLDLGRFPYERNRVKPFSLLWVRSFNPIYNPDLAVKILFEVRKIYPLATLTMVGPDNGSLVQTKELVHSLGLQDVIVFTGPVPNSALKNYYQSHSIYLNTTSYESFGVAVIEAAACGIPVVSGKVGEIPYLWEHGKNMLIADSLNANDFAREIGKLFSNQSLSESISAAARQKSETFNWKNISQLWLNLLQHENFSGKTIL